MLFNTLPFVVFALAFFSLWAIVRPRVPRNVAWLVLAGASLFFYGWWRWQNLFLLLGTATLDFYLGKWIARYSHRKRLLLAISLFSNIGSLFVFKYLDFVMASANSLSEAFGGATLWEPIKLTLPLGISFFTFQSMTYTIDIYRGKLEPARNILQFFAFVSLFPQLIAGPIVRASQLLGQLERLPGSTPDQRWEGLKLITYGLVKKSIVADTVGQTVNFFYDSGPYQSTMLWWIVAILFAIQIYCDFSGYSDIAIGLAKWMGIEFPPNFRHPYLSASFREYWNRWHISLSTWFRDYLYYPLTRRWTSRAGMLLAVNATFTISGLWHGARWTFVAWGLFHGLLLTLENLTMWDRWVKQMPGGRVLAVVFVFLTICVGLVIFRSTSLGQAREILGIMFSWQTLEHTWLGSEWVSFNQPLWWAIPIAFVLIESRHFFRASPAFVVAVRRHPMMKALGVVAIAVLLLACVYFRGPSAQFIYFQF